MAMVNMNNLLNGKDSRWLQLEVCREFQRNKCTRPDTECKFAHPPANVEVQNGRVTACYDSIKGRCNREKPPCKYFHPPQHLKDQLLINGRNHLALKNAVMQQMGLTPGQPLVPGQLPTVEALSPTPHHHLQQQIQQQLLATHAFMATNPYLTGMPQVGNTYSPYFAPSPIMPTIMGPADPSGVGSPLGVVPQTVAMPQKMPRTDRLETATMPTNVPGIGAMAGGVSAAAVQGGLQNASMASIELGKKRMRDSNDDLLMMDMKSVGSFYYENFAFPGMVPYKRPAGDKSGVPVYQPTGATTYQQLMQLQQPFVPVSCEYTGTSPLAQTSNQSVVSGVQNSIQTQATGLSSDANGILVDPNNPPPPPPPPTAASAASTSDKQAAANNHEDDSLRNSPELNHANSPQVSQLSQLAGQPTMSPMTSTSLTSMPCVVSAMSSMGSVHSNMSMANYTMANITNLNVLNSLGMAPSFATVDPATLAKEVAQKNYAKALKLSQAAQPYALNHLSAYTGVALNKQALSAVAAPQGHPANATSRPIMTSLAGLPGATALTSPLQAGLLAYQRNPSINPYSLIRQQILPTPPYLQTSIAGMPASATVQAGYMQNPYAAMLPGVAGVAGVAGVPGVNPHQLPAANPATQPQVAIPVSSSVIMQPYKKMKTT